MNTAKPNGDDAILFPPDAFGRAPIAWIVQPKDKELNPYLTVKSEVAVKRCKAGDYVTPYHNQIPPEEDDEL